MSDATVYTVQVDGEKKKAFDAIALKRFIESKKYQYSVLSLNPDKIDPDETAVAYIAKAAIQTLSELEDAINEVLGINTSQKPDVTVEEDTDDEVNVEDDSESDSVEVVEEKGEEKKEAKPIPKDKSDDEERIVL